MGSTDKAAPESYVTSLLAEGKLEAAFEVIGEFGAPEAYAPQFANLGSRLWRDGQTAEAVTALEKALELDAGVAAAWLTLGLVKLSQDDVVEGDRCLAEAVARDPKAAAAHYLRGVVAASCGREGQAIEHLTRCLEVNPAHREAAEQLRSFARRSSCRGSLGQRVEAALGRAESSDGESNRASLSVCLIVKDEEESLDRCLRSVKEVADQIVVVDTGSTDGTVDVARRVGAEVHEFEWCDDFAAARNAAITKATGDWILIVDADEELPPGSAAQLEDLLAGRIPEPVCQLVTVVRTSGELGRGARLSGHLRLFRNGLGLHFRGAIHEQLVDREGRLIESAVFTGIPVIHHGYLEPPAAMDERGERNLRLLAARAEAEPENALVLFYLGTARLGGGAVEEGIAALRRALELAEHDCAFKVKAAVVLAHGLEQEGCVDEAEGIIREALAEQPENPELLCGLGRVLEAQARVEEAVEAYQAATRGRFGPSMDYHDFSCRDATPRGRLATIYLSEGKAEQAAKEVEAALRVRPEAGELRYLRACALLCLERTEDARAELEAVLAENPENAGAHDTLGAALALQGRLDEATREFELALALNPGEVDTLCNLAEARRAQGDLVRARDAWEAALKAKPSHVVAWLGLGRTYWQRGAFEASARCYEMAAQYSGGSPEVMAEICAAQDSLARMAGSGEQREGSDDCRL